MLDWRWTRQTAVDLGKLGCAALLFAAPWILGLEGQPAWSLRASGYAMLAVTLAGLTCEAEWEPRANLWLGLWM